MVEPSLEEHTTSSQLIELLLQVVVVARSLALLTGILQPAPASRDITALQVLVSLGPLRASELAAILHISRAATTRLVDTLERAGLAQREPDPHDRRAVLVSVTPAGRLVALSDIAPAATLAGTIESLPTGDRAALQRGLEALLERLMQRLPSPRRH